MLSRFGAELATVMIGYAVYKGRLKTRRRRSLRREDDGVYVWLEIDGSPGRSWDRWDAEDAADSDGDGGGD
jgi:hypothetical protein